MNPQNKECLHHTEYMHLAISAHTVSIIGHIYDVSLRDKTTEKDNELVPWKTSVQENRVTMKVRTSQVGFETSFK